MKRWMWLPVLLTGCGSFTSFQTARALKGGEFQVQGTVANVALNGGTEVGARVRAGLGKGFEVGGEVDVASTAPPVLIAADAKYQFLNEPEEGQEGGAPLSAAVNAGAGFGAFSNFFFGQLIGSRKFGWIEPYFAYRFQYIDIRLDLDNPNDRTDIFDSILEEIVKEANRTDLRLHHFFAGAKIDLGSGFSVTPEISYIAGDASGLGSVGVGVGYQWEW